MDALNPTARIGDWLAQPAIAWSEGALNIARRCIVDTLGCMLAGASDPAARTARAPFIGMGGRCSVVGTDQRLPAPWAALANGTAAHALDFDENYAPAMAHASAVLLPTLLAIGQDRDVAGDAFVDAFLAGLEAMACIGFALNPVHRQRGWHATSTVGAVGAAAAAARLMRLDGRGCTTAMSLATSQAAGGMVQFGTMAKPLHAGLAAQAGVMSATWAEAGLSACAEPFLGPRGMQQLWIGHDLEAQQALGTGYEAHGFDLRLAAPPAQSPFALERLPPVLKLWPNCGSAHPAMQAALAHHAAAAPDVGAIAAVEVHMGDALLANLMYRQPTNSMEARFSLEYGVALMLARQSARLADFETALLHRPELQAWMTRVERHELGADEALVIQARVVLRFHDGRRRVEQVAEGELVGDVERPLSEAEIAAKFIDCAARVLAPSHAHQVLALFQDIGCAPSVAQLVDALQVRSAAPEKH